MCSVRLFHNHCHFQIVDAPDVLRVALGDLNSDGRLDVVVTRQAANSVDAYISNGGTVPQFTHIVIDSNADGAFGIITADMDNDGDIDVACTHETSGDVVVYFVQHNSTSSSISFNKVIVASMSGPRGISVGVSCDLNSFAYKSMFYTIADVLNKFQ